VSREADDWGKKEQEGQDPEEKGVAEKFFLSTLPSLKEREGNVNSIGRQSWSGERGEIKEEPFLLRKANRQGWGRAKGAGFMRGTGAVRTTTRVGKCLSRVENGTP